MKPLLPLLSFLLAALPLAPAAETDSYRTFTDEQGRTIRAVVVRASPEEVWIRRDDGRTFRVARATFSRADRDFIGRWEQTEALKAPNALVFAARRYSDGPREVRVSGATRNTAERVGYVVTLTNNSPANLENLEIEYRCFVWKARTLAESGQNRQLESYSGFTRLEALPPRSSREFQTASVELRSTRLLPHASSTTTNRRRTHDDLRGVWVRIRQNGVLIAEFSSPARLMEAEAW